MWQKKPFAAAAAVGVSRDGTTLVASGNTIKVFDPATGALRRTIDALDAKHPRRQPPCRG